MNLLQDAKLVFTAIPIIALSAFAQAATSDSNTPVVKYTEPTKQQVNDCRNRNTMAFNRLQFLGWGTDPLEVTLKPDAQHTLSMKVTFAHGKPQIDVYDATTKEFMYGSTNLKEICEKLHIIDLTPLLADQTSGGKPAEPSFIIPKR